MSRTTLAMGEPGAYRKFALNELSTDGRFNRDVSQNWVDTLGSQGFSFPAFHALAVWEDENGTKILLDGQHRARLARDAGFPEDEKLFPGILHHGLTLNQAAELFVDLNRSKLVGAWPKYKALRTAGHTDILDIDRILRLYDLKAGGASGEGVINSIAALLSVYTEGQPHGAVLSRTLKVLSTCYRKNKEAYRANILKGVALYIHEHREVEPDALATALGRECPSPTLLISQSSAEAGTPTQKIPMEMAIALTIEKQIMAPKKRTRKPKAA